MSELETRLAELAGRVAARRPTSPRACARVLRGRGRRAAPPPRARAAGGRRLASLRAPSAASPRSLGAQRGARLARDRGRADRARAGGADAGAGARRRSTSASASRSRADALVPRELGPPDAVYRAGDIVTLLYRPRAGPAGVRAERRRRAAVAVPRPHATRSSSASSRARTRRSSACTVDGEPGYWLAGAAHGLIYEDPTGDDPRGAHAARRPDPGLAARRLTLRLEADVSKSRALAIARSVR